MSSRTLGKRKEQPKLPAHLRHQLLKHLPLTTWRRPKSTLASFSFMFPSWCLSEYSCLLASFTSTYVTCRVSGNGMSQNIWLQFFWPDLEHVSACFHQLPHPEDREFRPPKGAHGRTKKRTQEMVPGASQECVSLDSLPRSQLELKKKKSQRDPGSQGRWQRQSRR